MLLDGREYIVVRSQETQLEDISIRQFKQHDSGVWGVLTGMDQGTIAYKYR